MASYCQEDRLAYALFTSLYAVSIRYTRSIGLTDRSAKATDSSVDNTYASSLRPQTNNVILEMVRVILDTDQPINTSPVMASSCPPLDGPMAILLKWGSTLPWSWATWDDNRLEGSEVAEYLVCSHLDTRCSILM